MRFSAFLAMVILSITNNWAAHAAQFESGGWYRVCSRAKLSRYNAHDGSFCALMHEIKNSDAPFFDLFLWGALAFIIQNEEYKVIGIFPLHMVTPMSLHGDGNDRVVLNAKACNQRGCYYFLSISKKLFYALSNSKALTLTLGLGRAKKKEIVLPAINIHSHAKIIDLTETQLNERQRDIFEMTVLGLRLDQR